MAMDQMTVDRTVGDVTCIGSVIPSFSWSNVTKKVLLVSIGNSETEIV